MHALQKDGSLSLVVSTGARAASELVRKCQLFAEAVKVASHGEVDYTSSADCIRFSNGGRVLSLPSGNSNALRGYSADLVAIDEAAFVDRAEEVFGALAPTLTRNPESQLVVTSTPGGKAGWFYDTWQKADSSWYVQTTTIDDAVADGLQVDVKELESMVADPDTFDREYRCKWAETWDTFLDSRFLEWYDVLPEGDCTSYIGFDVGCTSDRTAIVVAKEIGKVLYVDDITVLHKASYQEQLDVLKEVYGRCGASSGYIDSVGIGSAVAEFAKKQVSQRLDGYAWTSANKSPAYEAVRAAVFDHRMLFNRTYRSIIEEDFRNVHRITTDSGKVVFQANRSVLGHSDVTSAIVLASEAYRNRPAQASLPQAGLVRSANFLSRHVFSGLQKRL